MATNIVYGRGGFDAAKPDGNRVAVEEVDVPDPEPDPREARLAALERRAADLESAMNVTPTWAPGLAVEAKQRWQHDGLTYEVVQGHTTLAGWEPPAAPALFTPAG